MSEEKKKHGKTLDELKGLIPSHKIPQMRRFFLYREDDESGVSGEGIVVEGVELSNGKCITTWYSHMGAVTIHDSVKVVVGIHGHGGRTKLVWIDPDPTSEGDPPEETNDGD